MSITLSARDLDRLRGVQEAFLSPLEFPDSGAWRSEVNRRVCELTGADKAVFFVPGHGAWCDELDPLAHVEYESHFHQFDRGAEISLARGLTVASNRELYDYEAFVRSEWHNDFLAPHRCFRTLGLTVGLSGVTPPWSFLALQRERKGAASFDRRVRAQLELMAPAMRVGAETVLRSGTWRAALDGALDRVAESLAIYDGSGRLLHANTSLRGLLAGEPDRVSVEGSMAEAARAAASCEVASAPRRTVRTVRGGYEVRAFRAVEGFEGPVVVATVEPVFRIRLEDDELAERHGLTPREIEVTRRIASDDTNDEIAEVLGISPHTARRHTEAVMRKLGVASRRQVLDRITR